MTDTATVGSTPTHTHSREVIADRTADLLGAASHFTEEYQKPTAMELAEPGTGLMVPALIFKDRIESIPKEVFDPYRAAPERRTGTARMTRLDSFIAHVNRFKDNDSVIFARDDRTRPALTAVIDYHYAVNVSGSDLSLPATARFGEHRTTFEFPLSDEWQAWAQNNAKPMSMTDFAQFLEDRIVDVETIESLDDLNEDMRRFIGSIRSSGIASGSRLMELATHLHINENSVAKQAVNLASGEAQILFESQHTDATGAPVDVPGLFIICIPVFAHDGYYRLVARLRYRKQGGGISFWYELWRPDLVFDDAFDKACQRAADETGLPLLIGAPEA